MSNIDLYKDFRDRMRGVIQYMSYWDPQAFKDFQFAALDQFNEDTISKLDSQNRPHLVLDKTRIIIDAVSGNEILNRLEPKFYPRNLPGEDLDLEASEAVGEMYRWTRQQADVEHHESMMFRDMLICGVGCTDTYMDYTDSPDGRIMTARVHPFQASWDPTSQDANMADANFVVRDKFIPEREFNKRYPDFVGVAPRTGDIRDTRLLQRVKDRLSSNNTDRYTGSRSFQYFDPSRDAVHVWEYQWRELEPVTKVMIPTPDGSYESFEIPRAEAREFIQNAIKLTDGLSASLGADLPEVQWQPFERYKYYRAIIAGKEILEEVDEDLREFTLKFVSGFEDWSRGDRKYYFGLMKPMRDPQSLVNTFYSQAVHIWQTSPKGTFLHEPDFFEDNEEAYSKLAQPNEPIETVAGALTTTAKPKYQIIDNARSFAGTEPLFSFAKDAIPEASGVNPSYTAGLAGDVRRAATSAISLVQQQNLATIGPLFDNLKRYRKGQAGLVLAFAREYLPDEQVLRILGPTKANLVRLTKDDMVREYDIVVAEGPHSPNRAEEVRGFLSDTALLPDLLNRQLWPAEGWKYLGLPSDLGNAIMQRQSTIEQLMFGQPNAQGNPPPQGGG